MTPKPHPRSARVLALALVAAASLLSACGDDSSSASSDPSSADYDPAQTTLHDAGLEVCSESQDVNAGGLSDADGLVASRSFDVAADCNGAKTTPNTITVYQFDSKAS